MWVDPDDDPRETDVEAVDERSILLDNLRHYRLTLEMKCAGLDAEQMARRSVPPSTMSLLGLVRHMAEEERHFRRVMAGEGAPKLYRTDEDRDGDFNGAIADPRSWRTPGDSGGQRWNAPTGTWPASPTSAPGTPASPTSAPNPVGMSGFATSWWRRSRSTRDTAATPTSCASGSTAE